LTAEFRKARSSIIKNRVLIVESDIELRISISRLLNKHNFEVFAVENEKDAENYLDKIHFNCIIFGLNHPINESIQQLNTIVLHGQKPCVIILSSYDWLEIENDIRDLDFAEFATKPVKQEQLIEIIRRLKSQRL